MEGEPTTDAESTAKAAGAGMAMSVAMFAMAAASGIQALLYLDAFGVGGRTDGLFVALGLYATFGLFSQSIRVTAAPLLVGRRARLGPRELAAVMVVSAVPVAIATIVLAKPLAALLAPGLAPADRAVTASALPLLGAAMVLQLWAAGAATLLAVRDGFAAVARAYSIGAATGLAVFVGVLGVADELSLAWSMLAMGAATCSLMLWAALRSRPIAAERERVPLRAGDVMEKTALLLGRTIIYLAFNGLYVVTIAFVSHAEAGDATVLSYAYQFASYLVTGTAFALGMGRIGDMRRAAIGERAQTLAETVAPGYRYSLLITAPALAALVTSIAPLVGDLFPSSFGSADVGNLRDFGALLVPWTLSALLVNLLLPAMFALGKARLVNALTPALLAIQVAATAAGSVLFGAAGAIGAFFIAPTCFAITLALAGAGRGAARLGAEVGRDTLRFVGLAAVAFGGAAAIAARIADGSTEALIAGGAGAALYTAVLPLVAPHQIAFVINALSAGRRRHAPSPRPDAHPAGAAAALDR